MASSQVSSTSDSEASLTLTLDSRQFSREAALKAAYWFTKDLYIDFPPSETEHLFGVILRAKCPTPTLDNPAPKTLNELASEFRNALIDSELRIQVQRETSAVRELLLAKAFAEAGVLESSAPGSFDDPVLAVAEATTSSDLVVLGNSTGKKLDTPK
jgi:His-Xaa-Ser system protein HxsD